MLTMKMGMSISNALFKIVLEYQLFLQLVCVCMNALPLFYSALLVALVSRSVNINIIKRLMLCTSLGIRAEVSSLAWK